MLLIAQNGSIHGWAPTLHIQYPLRKRIANHVILIGLTNPPLLFESIEISRGNKISCLGFVLSLALRERHAIHLRLYSDGWAHSQLILFIQTIPILHPYISIEIVPIRRPHRGLLFNYAAVVWVVVRPHRFTYYTASLLGLRQLFLQLFYFCLVVCSLLLPLFLSLLVIV